MKYSAGILMYRFKNNFPEVFLVHPGGPFWKNKDLGTWSVPKGEYLPEEDPLDAAKREFHEETGLHINGEFIALEPVKQNASKTVYAWAVEGDADHESIISNTFLFEWPAGSGKMITIPEVDKAGWFNLEIAKEKLLSGQINLITQLELLLINRNQH